MRQSLLSGDRWWAVSQLERGVQVATSRSGHRAGHSAVGADPCLRHRVKESTRDTQAPPSGSLQFVTRGTALSPEAGAEALGRWG